ncbi:TOBE domain-containing protein [Peribacillus sp. NPDC097675]|uniref:TOBE domain-containing protein n=1 Tax=Peribacillus sp. NPDC097675 TaxID=3390618 RepID=UPI003D052CC8
MQLSARNQLTGKITDVKTGPISTEITMNINGVDIVSSITTASAESLNLKVDDEATAVIKASSIMIAK